MVQLRYWAGARAAAGVSDESVDATTLLAALEAARARRDESFARVIGVCSFVVDEVPVGRTPHDDVALQPDSVVEVLPPFAGGSGDVARCAGGLGDMERRAGGSGMIDR